MGRASGTEKAERLNRARNLLQQFATVAVAAGGWIAQLNKVTHLPQAASVSPPA